MNRRFHTAYDDFILSHYDEYHPAASNDIYGRMYSDRNHGELKFKELCGVKSFPKMTNKIHHIFRVSHKSAKGKILKNHDSLARGISLESF